MKRIFSVCVFLSLLGVAAAQQSTNNLPEATNSVAGNPIEKIKAKAEKGDASAQFEVGSFYFRATNYIGAAEWYQKSAHQGLAIAQSQLGTCYENGCGVQQNSEQAVKWFTRAAKQGDKVGQAMLGLCYVNGRGVPVNDVEAYKWLSLATSREWGESDAIRQIVTQFLKVCKERMSREEIAEAQRLAAAFVPRKEKSSSNSNSPVATDTSNFLRHWLFHYGRWLFDFKLSCGQRCHEGSCGHERRN